MSKIYVTINMIMTLDGHIADAKGRCQWGSSEDRRRMDILRSRADAVLVTRATIEKDNPLLVDRRNLYKNRQPKPVIVIKDTTKSLKLDCHVFHKPHPPGIVASPSNEENLYLPPGWERVCYQNMTDLAKKLAEKKLYKLLVEGGPTLNSLFLKEDLVNEIRLTLSPLVFAQKNPRGLFEPIENLPPKRFFLKSAERRKDELFLRYLKRARNGKPPLG
ncbi:MAG: RibD family protein [Leptospiraceae bacterium]|nr:RibD family protein [Leptospiraceae bacterium]